MNKHLIGLLSFGVGVFVSLGAAASGSPEPRLTKNQCVDDNEGGQDARASRRLAEAEARFRACSAESCPGPLREDCLRRLEEVRRATPSVVLVLKDSEGRLVSGASISLDGAPVGGRQEGALIRADPGEHTFHVAAEGYAPVTKKVTFEEGVAGREESIVLTSFAPLPGAAERPDHVGSKDSTAAPPTSAQRTISYFVLGAGALGLGFGGASTFLASGAHHDALSACPSHLCPPGSDGIDRERTAERWATTATLSVGVGAALLVGGLVLFFTAPKTSTAVTTARR